jgi:hypothetical protein
VDQPPRPLEAVISGRWRLALLGKAALLLLIGVGFAALAVIAVTAADHSMLVRVSLLVTCGPLALFMGWAGSLGLADAAAGKSVTEGGATVLKNRRSGYSMRVPSGRFVEYILWNPWDPLLPGSTYTVTYGKFSGVLVARPQATTTPPSRAIL